MNKLNIDPEKLLYSEQENVKCKDELTSRIRNISQKIMTNTECKEDLKLIKFNLIKKIDEHVKSECERIRTAKMFEIKQDLENCLENFENKIINSNKEGEQLKIKLEEELKIYNEILNTIKVNSVINNSKTPEPDYDEFDGDALMINESINEFSENQTQDKRIATLQSVLKKVEDLTNLIDIFLNQDFNSKRLGLATIPFNQDAVNLVYLNTDHPEYGLFTPNMFNLETKLGDNFSFQKDNECLIKFNCPFVKESNATNVNENIRAELLDHLRNPVKFLLKEKISSDGSKRHFFLRFIPNNAGIYKLTIKYKNVNILESPLFFAVLPVGNPSLTSQNDITDKSSISTEKFDFNVVDTNARLRSLQLQQQQQQQQNQEHHHSRSSLPSFPDITHIDNSNETSEKSFSNKISIGRGRFLRQKDLLKSNNGQISSSLSQKRKSPSYQSDLNNNNVQDFGLDSDNDTFIQESASRSKRPELMEIDQSKTSLLSNSVLTAVTNNNNNNASNSDQIGLLCILSDHIKKHSNQNAKSLMPQAIPELEAKFVKKFSNCSYPIGVRTCSKRNWLIVCDCGNDLIKIFDKNSGDLLKIIDKSLNGKYFFKRPSALLIDYENDDLIYVKDDKEILVFDMSKDCEFIFKFGSGILQRPYGLTFDKLGRLIVIDANNKNPLIHTFNKFTGEKIKSSPYQPVLPQYAKSPILNSNFYGNKANLAPFEHTKIRFIDCAKDHIFASDLGRSIIFKTNLDGEIVLAFGQFGTGGSMGQFNEPSGIHVDYDGKTVLVGDSKNNKLQIYDDMGNYKCNIKFIDENIVRPSDIHIDSHGYLYVVCFIQHCIKKFKLI